MGNNKSWHFSGCETDNQIDGVAKLAPIVACYAGKPEMLERVEEATRVTQNNDICVAVTLAAARLVMYDWQHELWHMYIQLSTICHRNKAIYFSSIWYLDGSIWQFKLCVEVVY